MSNQEEDDTEDLKRDEFEMKIRPLTPKKMPELIVSGRMEKCKSFFRFKVPQGRMLNAICLLSTLQQVTVTDQQLKHVMICPRNKYFVLLFWFIEFPCDRTGTSDAERSGKPNELVTPEIVDKVLGMKLADRIIKVRDMAESSQLSGSHFT